jgi:AraC family transcriptional regulator of adaptative response / DNA-3-methyladenine glycosylase II
VPSLTRLFPTASSFANATLEGMRKAGLTGARGATLLAMARAIAEGGLVLEPGRRIEEVLHDLGKISGIGEWTAQYIVMRALSWPDAFPHTDLGIRKALGETSAKKILQLAEKWRPWRAYAALHLWTNLSPKS